MRRGALTAFVSSHRLPWELVMAALTLVYVALSLVVDEGGIELVTARFYSSHSADVIQDSSDR